MNGLTVAHRTLPFGTSVKVTNCNNGKSVVVRVNDRGPSHRLKRRVIDLSQGAATRLDMLKVGVAPVKVEIVFIPPVIQDSHKQ
jgi:rare lipoprotein A